MLNGFGLEAGIACSDLSSKAIFCGLYGVGTFGTKEVVDVLREQVRVGHHRVISRIVFCSCGDDTLSGLHVGDKLFDLGDLLSGLLGLLNECILNSAGIAIKQGRSLNPEVVQNFKTFCADVCEILVAREIALLSLDVAVALRRCLNLLGIGLRLLGQIGLHPRSRRRALIAHR